MRTRAGAAVFTLFSALGLLAALTLTIERFKLLEDASYVPSCSLTPVLSCGSVMVTKQAALFGFPNPILGIVAFSVALVAGVLWLGRVELPHWFWLGMSAGLLLGEVFVHWLIFESLYEINALCPYCMVVWAMMIPIFVFVSVRNAHASGLTSRSSFVALLARNHALIITVWVLVIIALVGQRFWSYWSSLY